METNSKGSSPPDPLAEIAASRTALADRLVTPWWYHPIAGVLLAGWQLAVLTFEPLVAITGTALFVIGSVALVLAYGSQTGVLGRLVPGLTRWLAAAAVLPIVPGAISAWIRLQTDLWWPSVLLAGVSCLAVIVFGRKYDVELRATLRGPSPA